LPDNALLELNAVSYDIGGKRILDSIDWRIESHQHWVLLGRNGAGKTTLLQIACGYLWPNAGGQVLRGGQPLMDLRELRCRIGWVTSTLDPQIPRDEPALDTVVTGRYGGIGLKRLGGLRPTPAVYEEANEFLERLGMAEFANRPFGVLSQGERQKVLLARARMARPMLLVLDEPCAGLDPASRESYLAALEGLAQTPTDPAIVLVTHHVEEIMPMFTHLLLLEQGRAVASGPTGQRLNPALVSRLYGGVELELVWRNGRCWPIGGA
jgi:iron complex transport system ATP-binding protein